MTTPFTSPPQSSVPGISRLVQETTVFNSNQKVNGSRLALVGMNTKPTKTSIQSDDDPYTNNDFHPLALANSAVLTALRNEEAHPDADSYRQLASVGNTSTGDGSTVTDQLNIEFMSYRGDFDVASATRIPALEHSRTIPIPPHLAMLLGKTKLTSLMGLFPEANLSWMSVDDKLYLWEYGDSYRSGQTAMNGVSSSEVGRRRDDFVCFSVPSGQCIVSVGLVKPKIGVFKRVVEWCLVVTTPEEAILCALAREPTTSNSSESILEQNNHISSDEPSSNGRYDTLLRLIPTRYIVPTDSIPLLSICGTEDGRIFMGGGDGCIYEMAYDGFFGGSFLEDYQHDEIESSLPTTTPTVSGMLLSNGKRTLSSLTSGALNLSSKRPRKCRKINHSPFASTLVSTVVPGFVLRATSAAFSFGNRSTRDNGAIISLLMDSDRKALYALTSKGFIHVYDLNKKSNNQEINTFANTCPSPRLAASVDIPLSARKYIDCVARGRIYPPPLSSNYNIASCVFPGGGNGARVGLGGMDGARSILRAYDVEVEARKKRSGMWKKTKTGDGVLNPVSIHIIPPSESSSLTLMVVTRSGLRCYMSSLANVGSGFGRSNGSNVSTQLGDRFVLCHIRSPPFFSRNIHGDVEVPICSESTNVGHSGEYGVTLSSEKNRNCSRNSSALMATRGHYHNGITVLTIGSTLPSNDGKHSDDAVLAFAPNPWRDSVISSGTFSSAPPMEIVSMPMKSCNGSTTALLPGGKVWDVACSTKNVASNASLDYVLNLIRHSRTPTDAELSASTRVPPYFPPTKIRHNVPMKVTDNKNISSTSRPVQTSSSLALALIPTSYSTSVLKSAIRSVARTLLPRAQAKRISAPTFSTNKFVGCGPVYRLSATYGCQKRGFLAAVDIGRVTSNGKAVPRNIYGGGRYGHKRLESSKKLERMKRLASARSARLSPWLLNPSIVPLSAHSTQHLVGPSSIHSEILALNAGGLHSFRKPQAIQMLASALIVGGGGGYSKASSMKKNAVISSFFSRHGYEEGCAMCLTIAIRANLYATADSGQDVLISRSIQAALSHAKRPTMVKCESHTSDVRGRNHSLLNKLPSSGRSIDEDISSIGVQVPVGYSFRPSSLYDGLLILVSRLIRPVWYKPAVVVTEGKVTIPQRYGDRAKTSPARVELLLDDVTLENLRQPLDSLLQLMRDVFAPAVRCVPGAKDTHSDQNSGEAMKADSRDGNNIDSNSTELLFGRPLITEEMQNRSLVLASHDTSALQRQTVKQLNEAARLIEERNIHSLYRLISRTVQLLSLLSHLRKAHCSPELPEVDFGLLHGLTISQLVSTAKAQDRIESLLTNLVSGGDGDDSLSTIIPSAESNHLSSLLASQCYLYFSAGSRLAFLGFRAAAAAMQHNSQSFLDTNMNNPNINLHIGLSNEAASYLRAAARHWNSPSLVTGRLIHPDDDSNSKPNNENSSVLLSSESSIRWYDDLAIRALRYGSPLARAASTLMELNDVAGMVDVCLICAENFGGLHHNSNALVSDNRIESNLGYNYSWEVGLYHRPLTSHYQSDQMGDGNKNSRSTLDSSSSIGGSGVIISGVEVTAFDARQSCHAILFHHLCAMLERSSSLPNRREEEEYLVERMLSVASSSPDSEFRRNLYEVLVESGHTDTLLRIEVPDIEIWLRDVKKDTILLWRHYIVHGLDWMAGVVMWERGCAPIEDEIFLDERIECLTRAMNSFSSYLEKMGGGGKGVTSKFTSAIESSHKPPTNDECTRIINQISEQIDIAKLQARVLTEIKSSRNFSGVDDDNMKILSSSLVEVSTLYNDYSAPLSLFDICLLILQTCRHNDNHTILSLWKAIICEEILPCMTRSTEVKEFLNLLKFGSVLEDEKILLVSGGDESRDEKKDENDESIPFFEDGLWLSSLKNRVVLLGQELLGKGADFTFPVEFIAECLEGLCRFDDASRKDRFRSNQIDALPLPLQIFEEIQVPYSTLLSSYHVIMGKQTLEGGGFLNPHARLMYLDSISKIMLIWISKSRISVQMPKKESFGKNQFYGSSTEIMRHSRDILAQIDAYKAIIESLVSCDNDECTHVLTTFNDVEKILKEIMLN
mmetsp:Transcript_15304/g.21838  ORF Transcript_15304/g.21838 Transcript_15304/m.21838 type:complete len:2089 (+) Transcript_15304:174-6440(+)|eukprot:CAMPEP_0184859500 /NCGR_PEP_ID=MMETSP0580-20130426/4477_1 /TAXON_ID=1118495 /ORGANISM="Dactyliosolen fragilissimus" /LENGTH=2088 /DNA_ID=CAMNT_0027356143 /DNA_START=96 /DNA_END=6362 /DNA_ORIENTATION=+